MSKHGVSISEIEALFRSAPNVVPDLMHSELETRFIAIGGSGRLAFVVFTLRERDGVLLIRPIAARYMHRKEIEKYEKTSSKVEE